MAKARKPARLLNLPSGNLEAAWASVVWGTSPTPSDGAGEAPLHRILDAVAPRLGFERATLYLSAREGRALEPALAAGRPRDEEGAIDIRSGQPAAQAFRQHEPIVYSTMASKGCCACVPVQARGESVGVLSASRPTGGPPVTREELEALCLLAAQAGAALENQRLAEENKNKIEQFLALQRITREMTSTLDIGKLLGMVVEEALRLTGAQGALLYLLEPEPERLRLEAWAGENPPPGRQFVALGYGIAGWVGRKGEALRVSDRGSGDARANYGTRKSHLAVPLLSEGAVVGVLEVDGHREESFSETHEEILSIFAAQAAKAIEAARFFQGVRQERDFRDRILGGSPNGILALDVSRRVVWLNQSARRLLQLTEEPVGNPVERYLSSPDFLAGLRKVLEGQSSLANMEITRGDGLQTQHLLVNAFPLSEGETRGAALILQDLTDRKRLDEQVHRMARLASIGQLAAGIAHEIRNPLTGVGISLDILLEEEGLSEGGRGLVGDIGREIDRLEHLIRGLLDFARPQPVQRRIMRVTKALEWHGTFREQCAKKGVGFLLDLRQNPKLEGDPEKLKQVFLNLAINALEATDPGGDVRVIADQEWVDERPWVRVVVEDTGRGMGRETLDQLFNPFFTTKSEGTGLGLAIAHSIIEQHGGRIDVRSSPGAGTRVEVDLPALQHREE